MQNNLKIAVFSHHRCAGANPLDSLWFARDEIAAMNIHLRFFWTNTKRYGIKAIIRSDAIIFDGINSLRCFNGSGIFRLAKLLKKRIIIYWHETEWILNEALDQSDFIGQVISDGSVFHFHDCMRGKQLLVGKYGINAGRIFVVYESSDTWMKNEVMRHELPLPYRSGLFVCCAFVGMCKGVDYFIDIAKQVVQRRPDSYFIWCGGFDGKDVKHEFIENQIKIKELSNNVLFLGKLANPVDLLAQAEAFILPSRSEGMPKSIFEALLLGKPCVAFDVGGIREQLGEVGGSVLPVGDVNSFSSILADQKYARDEKAQAMRRRWTVERFGAAAFAGRLAEALKRVCHA